MKVKDITSIMFFVILFFACSAEDEILNDISNNQTVADSKEIIFSLNVLDGYETKAISDEGKVDPSENEATISQCIVAVFDQISSERVGYKLVKSSDLERTAKGIYIAKNISVFVKKNGKYNVYVIANPIEENNFKICYDESSFLSATQILNKSLNAGNLIKYGKQEATVSVGANGGLSFNLSSSIPLNQLTSRIDFNSLKIGYKGEGLDKYGFKLKRVTLENAKNTSNINGNYKENSSSEYFFENLLDAVETRFDVNKTLMQNKSWGGDGNELAVFYTFENTSSSKVTTLVIDGYIVDDQKQEKPQTFRIPIGRENSSLEYGCVERGKWYSIKVTLTPSITVSKDVTFTLSYEVVWNDPKEIELPSF